jgi:proteasome lid subunit RPN8/RPN11
VDRLDGLKLDRIRLSRSQWEAVVSEAEHLAPEEACGLLAGDARGKVEMVFPVTNALHSPVRFRMDAQEQLKALLQIEANDWQLIAIYHSHPRGPDKPSMTDVQEAYYPEAVTIILFVSEGGWRGRGFYIRGRDVDEVPIIILE